MMVLLSAESVIGVSSAESVTALSIAGAIRGRPFCGWKIRPAILGKYVAIYYFTATLSTKNQLSSPYFTSTTFNVTACPICFSHSR